MNHDARNRINWDLLIFYVHLNIILQSRFRFSKLVLSVIFVHQFLIFHMRALRPAHLITLHATIHAKYALCSPFTIPTAATEM
jgi:hypothetical protein